MQKFLSGLLATTLAATFAITTMAPLNAAPLSVPRSQAAQTDVQTVQDSSRWWRMNRRLERQERRDFRQNERRYDSRYDNDSRYYNGHRGYRQYRRGHRQHNGLWFPAAAFITGAIIANSINRAESGGRNDHVQWCYDRYKSYRASTDTYKPHGKPRRACNSPYN